MKKSTFIKLRVARIILLALFCTLLFAQEKDKYGKYPADKPHPFISEYPPAIQKLDLMKSEYYKNLYQNKDYQLSEKDLMEYANAHISSYMYHYGLQGYGYHMKYVNESAPVGINMIKKFKNLPFPQGFLIFKKGIILGEIISDEILPKKKTPAPPPRYNRYNYVAEIKVIDDIFNSFAKDTILVRHSHSLISEYYEHEGSKILFTFKPGGTIQRKDSVQYIYEMGQPNEFMFVKDSIIYDPNNILKITGKHYSNFKNDLLNYINEGITK